MAAKIIREDIQSKIYNNTCYPATEHMFHNEDDLLPESLKLFVQAVTSSKNGDPNVLYRKRLMIYHSIISMCRQRTFISPIQLAVGVYCLRHYGSRQLIDILHSLGMSTSYSEVRRYEYSRMCSNIPTEPQYSENLIQFVFDNADINTRTLDGHGTFHSMGGIRISTPPEKICEDTRVERLVPPSADIISALARRNITFYKRPTNSGLLNMEIKSLMPAEDMTVPNLHHAVFTDNVWLMMHLTKSSPKPSWNGLMHAITQYDNPQFNMSSVTAVPFFNMAASNLSTIYTSLLFACEESKKMGQDSCIVTFDQPLYWKAVGIVASADPDSDLAKVVVKLGGFHLLMSYLGTIGHIMSGSGLEELWALLYAQNTVVHMFSGTAYARALRAHFLTYIAVYQQLWKYCYLGDEDKESRIRSSCDDLISGIKTLNDLKDHPDMKELIADLAEVKTQMKDKGRTAKLWLQYLEQVQMIMLYIRAERTGDWDLYVYTLKCMLPYFHAAGHLNYAKSIQCYLQQMEELKIKMKPEEFAKLFHNGYFTVRRKDCYWSGTAADMVIEQSLMRAMKVSGGLSHGRGITDSTLARWVLSFPITMEVSEARTFLWKTFIIIGTACRT